MVVSSRYDSVVITESNVDVSLKLANTRARERELSWIVNGRPVYLVVASNLSVSSAASPTPFSSCD